jgi:hypothetical protein
MDTLNYFINKVCTIFVEPTNRNLDEKSSINYFVGKIIKIDSKGILIEHLGTSCRGYYFIQKVIGISEEQVISESEAQEKKRKKENVIQQETNPYSSFDDLVNMVSS